MTQGGMEAGAELNGGKPFGAAHVGPVLCSCCGESPHALKDCPACQNAEVTRMHLLNCRKLMREALGHLSQRFGDSIGIRVRAELNWPNVRSEVSPPAPGASESTANRRKGGD